MHYVLYFYGRGSMSRLQCMLLNDASIRIRKFSINGHREEHDCRRHHNPIQTAPPESWSGLRSMNIEFRGVRFQFFSRHEWLGLVHIHASSGLDIIVEAKQGRLEGSVDILRKRLETAKWSYLDLGFWAVTFSRTDWIDICVTSATRHCWYKWVAHWKKSDNNNCSRNHLKDYIAQRALVWITMRVCFDGLVLLTEEICTKTRI